MLGYYFANRETIDAYVRQRDAMIDVALHDMEAHLTPEVKMLRNRLRAYKQK